VKCPFDEVNDSQLVNWSIGEMFHLVLFQPTFLSNSSSNDSISGHQQAFNTIHFQLLWFTCFWQG